MNTHHRGHFLAFALLPALNTLGLLIHGVDLSTNGTGNTGRALVIILVSTLISLASAAISSFKRALNLGYESRIAAFGLIGSLFLGPFVLLVLLYLSLATPRESALPASTQQTASIGLRWLWAPAFLLAPWMALRIAFAIP